MDPVVNCAGCGRNYRWKPELAGKRMKCKCGGAVKVPPAPAPDADDAEPDGGFDLNALAALGTGTPVEPRSQPAPAARGGLPPLPTYAPKPAKAQATPGNAGNWAKGIVAALNPWQKEVHSREQQVATFWIYSMFFILGGLAVLAFSWQRQNAHEAFMKVAKKVPGTIIDKPTIGRPARSKLNSDRWDYKFSVNYVVAARQYKKSISIKGSDLPGNLSKDHLDEWAGEPLGMYYDPSDPAEAKAIVSAETATWTWAYVLGAAFVLVGGYFLFQKWPY